MSDKLIEKIKRGSASTVVSHKYANDMEARILADAEALKAADRLADLMSVGECPWREETLEYRDFWQDRQEALAAYNEKRGERK